jgi:very-short-patch-repair endonuclease
MDDVAAVLGRLGGAARWSALRSAGVSDGRLRVAVRSNHIRQVGRGAFATHDADADIVVAADLGGALTCSSGARLHGLDVLDPPDRPHIAVPRHINRKTSRATVHRTARIGAGVLVPLLPCLVECLRCLPPVAALVAVDSALRQGLVSVPAMERRLSGPGSAKARQILAQADRRSGSAIETVLRVGLWLAGLCVVPQAYVDGVGRVDFLIDGWLVVEVDGFEYHSDRASYRNDRRRANALTARGMVLLRFSYEDVRYRLPQVVALICAVRSRSR